MIWSVRCYNTLSYVSHMNKHLTKKWTLPADGLCRRFSTFCSKTHFLKIQKKLTKNMMRIGDVSLVQNFTKYLQCASEVSGENSC